MAWQFTDALDEVDTGYGPNLLTGDYQAQNPGWVLDGNTWSGEGSLHLHEGDPYTGPIITSDTTHVVTADVMASSEVTVTWAVYLGTSDGDVTLGPWSETIPAGAWVTVWQEVRTPPGTLGGSPAFTATGPVQVRAPRASLVMDQTVVRQVVAGDPDGARVVLAGDALTAYDQTGTETARIAGEGGEFVGGSFRTSDQLPGQVTLYDTGFEDPLESGIPGPGVGVTQRNPDGFTRFPGVGPSWGGMTVSGGRDATGRWATVEASPTSSTLRAVDGGGGGAGYISTAVGESRILASGPDGESGEVRSSPTSSRLQTRAAGGAVASQVDASSASVTARTYGTNGESGWMRTRPGDAEIAYVDSLNTYFSRIRATETEASLFTRAGGANRYLTVDADGIWVKTYKDGAWDHYNLEETAQDSGWQPITLESGITGNSSPAWRNKNGVIYFQGLVNATWVQGWNTIATGLDAITPAHEQRAIVPVGGTDKPLLRMVLDTLRVYVPVAGGQGIQLSSLTYPLG